MRQLATVLLILPCAGCAAHFNLMANRFDTPEVQGGFGKFRAEFGGGGSQEIVLTEDYTSVPADSQHPSIVSAAEGRFALGAGLLDRLDLDLKGSFAEGRPYILQLKYQLVGEPRTSTSSDNFSVAVSGGVGGVTADATSSTITGSVTSSYKLSGTAIDTALIVGQRFSTHAMLYGSVFYTNVNYSGDQLPESGPGVSFSGRGYQEGLNLGLEFGFDVFRIKTEVAAVRAYSGDSARSAPFFGVTGVFYF